MPAFILLMILVGLNLRPALSSLSPVLNRIQDDTALTALGAGALTTLPVLCLGIFAPTAPWLAKRLGPERTLSFALAILAFALLLRGSENLWLLYGGTVLAGAAIGVCGTLLPALVKRELPKGADVMTGVYTMALCLGGALGAGLSIPLSDALGGWGRSLASWSLIALLALVAWRRMMPQTRPEKPASTAGTPRLALWREPLAWQVTGLMGSQSSLAYIVFGWLPVLMQRRGLGEAEAGSLLAISVMVQLIAALGTPWLARLGRDQRPAILLVIGASISGLLLLLSGPVAWRWWGVVLLGLGQGGSFSMALTLIALRSGNSRIAGKLSSMAQGFGYCLAALGPLSIGIMLDIGAGLTTISILLALIAMLAAGCAMMAGRNRRLDIDDNGHLITR
ncbi:CynX/NimT family MFS transporter [Aidingimonas halophila]|uniref:MFS transporter, CP family, cyanate transporter n=1 Tax=Aidingimonas halophila TaxID=574349 RepID=A0A1H3GBV4_9GAMM|nr:MFS transporter [Aidingimonas halophila]GHC32900.1 MFS transporter [Aidingimonas halophila]SDY00547.1 MFS transporter, CP family, cyanate transporter [Aidingimonas halophila]